MSTRKEICPEFYFDYQSEKNGIKGRKRKLAIHGAILITFLLILIIMSPSLLDLDQDSEALPENSEKPTCPSFGNKISANQKKCNFCGIELKSLD